MIKMFYGTPVQVEESMNNFISETKCSVEDIKLSESQGEEGYGVTVLLHYYIEDDIYYTKDEIKKSSEISYRKQCEPDTTEYECFFHYTDELLYQAGFEQGIKTVEKIMYSEEEVKTLFELRAKEFSTGLTPFNKLLLKQDLDWFNKNKK